MGFDNECILNIQSLAGEYFCPVCRTLVYPHEALQTQCTHLYCKPCLTYVVGSTQACPYDGYLVTEAGSKPLMESNKALAETIGKTSVHCLYHRSGCVWQGPLSECTSHCSGCAFGNSPVVCNRCGIQIVHRQVQEHAQTCNVNGANSQPQGSETAQDAAVSVDQSKIANQVAPPPASQPSHTATGPSNGQNVNQTPPATNPLPQAPPATPVPAPEQWYQQQQYQQYYQQYPGYDLYQQQPYQQYYPYQQQPQNQPPVQPQPQSQPQIQAPIQPQPQTQPQPQPLAQGPPQIQMHSQAQPPIPSSVQPQPLYPQAAVIGSSQNQGHVNAQQQVYPGGQIQSHNQPLAHGHMPPQSYPQVQPHPVQNHPQSQPQPQMQVQVPQYQQPHPQMHHSQPPQVHPQSQPQPHFQPLPQPPPQSQPMNPSQHPPVQSMTSHPPYSSQPHQPIQHAPPMQVHPPAGSLPPTQFPQPPPHMRPAQPPHMLPSQAPPTQQHIHPHNQPGLPAHPRPIALQVQQPTPQQYVQPPQPFPGQLHHAGSFAQVRPQGPPQPMQQPPLGFGQPQQATALPHGMPPPQSYMGRPPMLSQGGQPQSQQFPQPQSSGAPGVPPHARPPQFGPSQPSVNQSNTVNMTNQPHVYPEQQLNQYAPPLGGGLVDRKGDQTFERRTEQQEDKSPILKKSESVANEFRPNFNQVKPETGTNDERKTANGGEDDHRKDEKDTVSELHQVQGVPGDSGTIQRVKEESKDVASDHKAEDRDSMKQGEAQGFSEAGNGSLAVPSGSSIQQGLHERTITQSQTPPQEQSSHPAPLTEQGRSPHPMVRPVAPGHPPSHIRPPGHGYLPHGPHPGDHFQPPGSFHPDFPLAGPSTFSNNSRGYDPQYNQGQSHARVTRMSQGEPLGPPPLPHGPDGQTGPRHPGPMEPDMYQNPRPSHFDSRRPDPHFPGNADRGPYGQHPFGVESSSMRMNGGAPPPDEKFRTPDAFPMGPTRHHEQGKQFPGPPHLGSEDSPKYGSHSHSSRPLSGYGMDGPPRFLDKDSHGYGSGPFHHNDSGGRPLHDDNRGRFDDNRHNPDFLGPMHGFGRHRMDRGPGNPSRSFGGGPHSFDEMERHSFGERFGPPGHMSRGEFDGPRGGGEPFGLRNRPHMGDPGFSSFQDYGRSGELHGPGGFFHKPPFGESFGPKSDRPHLGEPGFRISYSRKGFPSDGGFFAGGPDSFDGLRKRKMYSMGWCRICKIDCESVEGLDMHGQTREHQRMAMDMVISIKQKSAKKHKASNDHSAREEPSKLRNTEVHARVNVS